MEGKIKNVPPTVRRMVLPGGGSFDLPLPNTGGAIVERDIGPVRGGMLEGVPGWVWFAAGAVVGGTITWLVVRSLR